MGQGQGQLSNINAHAQGHVGFPHFHVQLPHIPEFGAQRAAPAPGNTPTNNVNVNTNLNQTVPANPFVNAQQAAAITNTEEQLMQHLRSQGIGPTEAENIRRSTMTGRQADRLRRGENPVGVHLDLEDEDEDDMMDIDEGTEGIEGMGMVAEWAMNQGLRAMDSMLGNPGAPVQTEQDRQDYDSVMNFLENAARQGHGQPQGWTQRQGQAQRQEQRTQGGAGTPGAQSAQQPQQPPSQQHPPQQQRQPHQQPRPPQQQAPGFPSGYLRPEDDRSINDFFSRMFSNMGAPQQQAQAQPAQRQDDQPQVQAQPQPQTETQSGQPGQESAATANADNNGGRRRQAQFAFGNVTFGSLTNFGPLFNQVPMFNPNGNGDPNVNSGASQERVKKAWTLPPAPGPTLRQRIERKERDAGLRCYDISCGVGPSDEDPALSDETIAAGLRQLIIMSKNHGQDGKPGVCTHTFHPGCLVSAERVALGGADVSVIEGGDVEVSCPVCRSAGCVTKQEWEAGILALA